MRFLVGQLSLQKFSHAPSIVAGMTLLVKIGGPHTEGVYTDDLAVCQVARLAILWGRQS